MFYTPEQKGALVLGQVRQLRHPDACAHVEFAGPADTVMRVTVRKETYYTITIAYRWWWVRVVVGHIVIRCVDAWWILHFTLQSHWFRDAFPIDALLIPTSYCMKVLEHDAHA
jgi:hypothetical protein